MWVKKWVVMSPARSLAVFLAALVLLSPLASLAALSGGDQLRHPPSLPPDVNVEPPPGTIVLSRVEAACLYYIAATTLYGVVEDVRRAVNIALGMLETTEEPVWVITREGKYETIYSVINNITGVLGQVRNNALDFYLLASAILTGDIEKTNQYYPKALAALGSSLESVNYVIETLAYITGPGGEDLPPRPRRFLAGGAALAVYDLTNMSPKLCVVTKEERLPGLYYIDAVTYGVLIDSRLFEIRLTSGIESEEYKDALEASMEYRRITSLNLYARGTDYSVTRKLGDPIILQELPKCGDELLNSTSPGIRSIVCMGQEQGRIALLYLASTAIPFLGSIDTWIAFPGNRGPLGIEDLPGIPEGGQAIGPPGMAEELPFDLVPERPEPQGPQPATGDGNGGASGAGGGVEVPGGIGEAVEELERRVREINERIIDLGSILRKLQIEIPGDLEGSSIFNALYNSTGIYAVTVGGDNQASYGLEAFALFSVLLGMQVAKERVRPVARLVRLIRYSRRGDDQAMRAVACYEAVSKLLEYRGLGRLPGETPREYLDRASRELGPEEVRVLEAATSSLEQALYKESEPDPAVLEECVRGYGVLLRRWLSIRRQ